jgi:hypothetical protein
MSSHVLPLSRLLPLESLMEPYIKSTSPLRGDRKPGLKHGKLLPRIEQRQKDEVAATRRALKKAARREGQQQILEEL